MKDFGLWLSEQIDRSDPIGDIAREVERDEDLVGLVLTPSRLREHVEKCGGNEYAIRAVMLAGNAYKLEATNMRTTTTSSMRPKTTGLQYRDHVGEKVD